ncbi:MAG TPA: YIP1 family protein [Thermoanaerobaculia bacterium]|nr:YIP1 family protein [Thermoanaerobaculia bacterium]
MALEDSSPGRLIGALVAPVKTFRSLAQRPTWGVAFLAVYLLGSGLSLLSFQKVDFVAGVKAQMAEQGRELPAGSEERIATVGKVLAITGILLFPAFLFLVPAIYLVFNLLGGELDYRRSLSVVVHASLPRALAALLSVPVVLSRNEISLKEIQGGGLGLLHSNLSFLAPDAGPALRVLLTSCDLFTVWTLALTILGFHLVARVGKGTAAAVVLLFWLLVIGLFVGLALLGTHARGGS